MSATIFILNIENAILNLINIYKSHNNPGAFSRIESGQTDNPNSITLFNVVEKCLRIETQCNNEQELLCNYAYELQRSYIIDAQRCWKMLNR